MTPEARKGWDLLTDSGTEADFSLIGEGRRHATARPRARLCIIDLNGEEPVAWWHFAGETRYRRVGLTWLLRMQSEMRNFAPDAVTIIAGVAMARDVVSNATSIALEGIAASASISPNGAH